MRVLKWAVLAFGTLLMVGLLAVGLGWGAHALVDWMAPVATTPVVSSVPGTETPFPTPTLPPMLETPSRPLPAPTSTLAPTSTPDQHREIVQANEGLYDVCRRHCPGRWPVSRVPHELDQYAHDVAAHNGLSWPRRSQGPRLDPGQELLMLPCPSD